MQKRCEQREAQRSSALSASTPQNAVPHTPLRILLGQPGPVCLPASPPQCGGRCSRLTAPRPCYQACCLPAALLLPLCRCCCRCVSCHQTGCSSSTAAAPPWLLCSGGRWLLFCRSCFHDAAHELQSPRCHAPVVAPAEGAAACKVCPLLLSCCMRDAAQRMPPRTQRCNPHAYLFHTDSESPPTSLPPLPAHYIAHR